MRDIFVWLSFFLTEKYLIALLVSNNSSPIHRPPNHIISYRKSMKIPLPNPKKKGSLLISPITIQTMLKLILTPWKRSILPMSKAEPPTTLINHKIIQIRTQRVKIVIKDWCLQRKFRGQWYNSQKSICWEELLGN